MVEGCYGGGREGGVGREGEGGGEEWKLEFVNNGLMCIDIMGIQAINLLKQNQESLFF